MRKAEARIQSALALYAEQAIVITRINHFEAKPGSEQQLFEFLQSVIAIIQNAKGCRAVRLLRSTDHAAQLAIIEEWDSIADHQNAAKAIPPEKMKEAMALFGKPPAGMYYTA